MESEHSEADRVDCRCRSVADVAEHLMAKYETSLSLNLITGVVRSTAGNADRLAASDSAFTTILGLADRHLATLAASAL